MIEQFCDWLSRTNVSVAFQSANWFVPLVQTVHIIAIAILLTALAFNALGDSMRTALDPKLRHAHR